MAERRAAVFIVATSNDIESLPPELVRKGRLDEIFFVDLPGAEARREIFRLHLGRRGQDGARFDLTQLAERSDGFSGAEIEQTVICAAYEARARDCSLDDAIVLEEVARTRPLSVVMAERVAGLRAWAAERTGERRLISRRGRRETAARRRRGGGRPRCRSSWSRSRR
jgi:SpoVK/Ycf46/Vps4 family AAA+-type ATPase